MASARSSWILISGLLLVAIYSLGFSGPFLFDDAQNIQLNPAVQPESLSWSALQAAWNGNQSGPLGRPIASLSFALNFLAGGLDPFGYKLVNVLLHLLAGAALFGFLHCLLTAAGLASPSLAMPADRARRIALLATALWLLHPLHVSTVLYVVQRMTVLAGLFGFLGLWAYCHGRVQQLQGQGRQGWGWILLAMPLMTLAAALGKENGLLIPLLCALIELSLLRLNAATTPTRYRLRTLYAIGLLTGLLILLVLGPEFWRGIVGGYGGRPFTLEERLLSEARVMWFYLRLLLAPDVGAMNLYHDDFPLSSGWLAPVSTLPAVIGLLLAGLVAALQPQRAPWLAFAVLFFLAGHLLESSVIPLELVFEHRNYLPSAGWMLLLSVLLFRLGDYQPKAAFAATGVLLFAFTALLASRSWLFGDDLRLSRHSLQNHPKSVRTQLWAGDSYRLLADRAAPEQVPELLARASGHYREAARLDKNETIGLFEVVIADVRAGQPPEPGALAELRQRLATATPSAATVNGGLAFAREISERGLPFPMPEALMLLDALVANPALVGGFRGTALASLGELHWFAGNRDQARALYAKAQSFRPDDAYIWLSQAAIAVTLGDPEAAEAHLLQARRYDSGELSAGLDLLAADLAAARKSAGAATITAP